MAYMRDIDRRLGELERRALRAEERLAEAEQRVAKLEAQKRTPTKPAKEREDA